MKFPTNWKPLAVVGVTAALLVPLLVLGGPAFARTGAAADEYQYSGSSQYEYKVQICHRTHSQKHPWVLISISNRALPAHLRHGDVLPTNGQCPAPAPQAPKQHGHGDENDQGNSSSTTGDEHGKGHH